MWHRMNRASFNWAYDEHQHTLLIPQATHTSTFDNKHIEGNPDIEARDENGELIIQIRIHVEQNNKNTHS